ncbi:MAG: hypothetical protein H0T99_07105, partial [Geodermatophilaceae bacterium]|nr:hypothetical protein [Geodermatophilaceae bacterium]
MRSITRTTWIASMFIAVMAFSSAAAFASHDGGGYWGGGGDYRGGDVRFAVSYINPDT